MNKTQLVDALAEPLGDRRTAASAVDGVLDTIMAAVGAGDSVSITGFGVFEPRARAARVARNPRTGEAVEVAATTVPAFRPGAAFRAAVGGSGATPAPRATPARSRAGATTEAPVDTSAKPARKEARAAAFAAEPEPAKKARGKAGKDSGKRKKAKAKK